MNKGLKWILLFFAPVLYLMPLSLLFEATQNNILGIVFWIVLIPTVIWEFFCMFKLITFMFEFLKKKEKEI